MLMQRLADWKSVDPLKDRSAFSIRTVFTMETIVRLLQNIVITLSQVAVNCLV